MANENKPNTSLAPANNGPNIGFTRAEIVELEKQYVVIRDCIAGSKAIKKKKNEYLPIPNEEDENQGVEGQRYRSYITRAVFYNVTKRTLNGLVGQIFLRDPVVELPPVMDVLKENISGSGVKLDQLAYLCCSMDIAFGRGGLLVDYPDVDVPATQQDLQLGKVRPSVLVYNANEIINWRTTIKGGNEVLSLVVLHESMIDEDDGFEQKTKEVWRVLSLGTTGNAYQVDLYERGGEGFSLTKTYYPKDGKGKPLTFIPFTFFGVMNNDSNPDDPPLYDMAELNIAHYRNSADYEEACFIAGQPTLALTGLTEDWVKNVLKDKILLGSRSSVMLPVGGDAKLVQAEANAMPFEAMQMKERQMVAIGAKLVEQKTVQRTLGEAELENTAEVSILASIAKNVESAIISALKWCALFMNADGAKIKYELNTEFDLTQLDPQERQQTQQEWEAGGLSTSEYRANLRRAGVATLDDDEFKAQITKEKAAGIGPIQKVVAAPGSNPQDNKNKPAGPVAPGSPPA